MIFRIKIWDRHELQVFTDEGRNIVPHPKDDLWHKFTFGLETDRIRIDYFREYVLFDQEEMPIRCVKIFFNDESAVYGRYTYETFEKYYNEVYLPMVPKNLSEIVEDLKGQSSENQEG